MAPDENSISILKDILAQLEDGAAKLTTAMFSAPASAGLKAQWESEEVEPNIKELLKSALDDIKSK
jgi:hypothetical protein